MTSRIAWLALLVPFTALAADTAEPTPEDLTFLQDSTARMATHVAELRADVRERLTAQRDEEALRLKSAFEAAITREDNALVLARNTAIDRLEAFLRKYPAASAYPDQAVRLANLYIEREDALFDVRLTEYEARPLDAAQEEDADAYPRRDYARPIALYQDVLARYPGYEARPAVLFNLGLCYHKGYAVEQEPPPVAQFDLNKGRDLFLELLGTYPTSKNAPLAAFWLGQYYYDLQPANVDLSMVATQRQANLRTATTYYKQVLQAGDTNATYQTALYKLGWTYYKLNEFDEGLKWLAQLTEATESGCRAGDVDSCSKQNEALELLAETYKESSQQNGGQALAMAQTHLAQFGERPWVREVYVRLANTLWDAGDPQTVAAYTFLQQQWPTHPDNPVYQQNISLVYAESDQGWIRRGTEVLQVKRSPLPADLPRTKEAQAALKRLYFDGTPWAKANATNPAAIARARAFIELTIADVVTDSYTAAVASSDPAVKLAAAAEILQLMTEFPLQADYAKFEKGRAELLVQAGLAGVPGAFAQAIDAYETMSRNMTSPFREETIYLLPDLREQALKLQYGGPEAGLVADADNMPLPPEGAIVEGTVSSKFGKEHTRYTLSPEHAAYIASCDRLASTPFDPKTMITGLDGKPIALATVAAEYLPGCAYRSARVVYAHGQYDEARTRFDNLIARYPKERDAGNAAILYVRSFESDGDFAAARTAAERFTKLQLATGSDLAVLMENADLSLANRSMDAGDLSAAADAFLAFVKQYPKSEKSPDALNAAADLYTRSGRGEDANEAYKLYLQLYPQSPNAPIIALTVATNYANTFETARAVEEFEAFAKKYPRNEKVQEALYNATLLRRSLPDPASTARAQEKFVATYPDYAGAETAEAIFWAASEFWGQVSPAQQLDFYARYLKRYPDTNAEHVIEALYAQAKAAQAKGDTKKNVQLWAQIDATFAEAIAAGKKPGSLTRRRAAEGAIEALRKRVEAYKQIKWVEDGSVTVIIKSNAATLKAKNEELAVGDTSILKQVDTIRKQYMEAEAVTAATTLYGLAQFSLADFINDFGLRLPGDMDGDGEEFGVADTEFQDRLTAGINASFGARAAEAPLTLQSAITTAQQYGWSSWATMAQDELARRGVEGFGFDRPETVRSFNDLDLPLTTASTIELAPAKEEGK